MQYCIVIQRDNKYYKYDNYYVIYVFKLDINLVVWLASQTMAIHDVTVNDNCENGYEMKNILLGQEWRN